VKVSRQLQHLFFAVFAWCLAMASFVFFRYSQLPELPLWANGHGDLVTLALFLGTVFGGLHWLSNLLADISNISRLPYIFSVVFKGAFLFIGALTLAFMTQFLDMWTADHQMFSLRRLLNSDIIKNTSFQAVVVYLVIVRVGLAFIEQVALLVGPRVLLNIGLGKYHKPRYEERLFLFVDMVSSTTHAETLGDVKFSRLIQDSFSLLTETVNNNDAEIYRYMGDSVLIHWPLKEGLKQERCLNIYFEFCDQLNSQRDYFEKKYGFVPKFKAAIHGGQVVAAVVGVHKQEISYFSDVVNTLARLQDQCNPLGQRILLSSDVANKLKNKQQKYQISPLGPIQLKGKQYPIEVFAAALAAKD
jgi:adenylate cyclase